MAEMSHSAEFLEAFMIYYVGKQAEGWDYQRAIQEFVRIRNTKETAASNSGSNDSKLKQNDLIEDKHSKDVHQGSPSLDCAEYVTIESTSPEPEEIHEDESIPELIAVEEKAPAPFLSASKALKLSAEVSSPDVISECDLEKSEPVDKVLINEPQTFEIDFDKVPIVRLKRLSQRRIQKYTQRGKKSKIKLHENTLTNSNYEKLKMKAKFIATKLGGGRKSGVVKSLTKTSKKYSPNALNTNNDHSSAKSDASQSEGERAPLPISKMKRIPKKVRTPIDDDLSTATEWVQVADLMSKTVTHKKAGHSCAGFVKYIKKSPLRREKDCSFELGNFLRQLQTQVKHGIDLTSPPGGHRAYKKRIQQKEEEHKKRLKQMRFENWDRRRSQPYDRKLANSNKEPIGKRKNIDNEGRKRILKLDQNSNQVGSRSPHSSKRSRYDDDKEKIESRKIRSEKSKQETSSRHSSSERSIHSARSENLEKREKPHRGHGNERKLTREEWIRKNSRDKKRSHSHDSLNKRQEHIRRHDSHLRSSSNERNSPNVKIRKSVERSNYSERRREEYPNVSKEKISRITSVSDERYVGDRPHNSYRRDRDDRDQTSSDSSKRERKDTLSSDKRDECKYSSSTSTSVVERDSHLASKEYENLKRLEFRSREDPSSSSPSSIHGRSSKRDQSSPKINNMDNRRSAFLSDRQPSPELKRPRTATPEVIQPSSPPYNRAYSPLIGVRDNHVEKLIQDNQHLLKENRKFFHSSTKKEEEKRSSRTLEETRSCKEKYDSSSNDIHRQSPNYAIVKRNQPSLSSSTLSDRLKISNDPDSPLSNHPSESNIHISPEEWLKKKLAMLKKL